VDDTKIDEAEGLIVEGGKVVADRRRRRRTPAAVAAPAAEVATLTRTGAEQLQSMGVDAKPGDKVTDDGKIVGDDGIEKF